MSQHTWDRAYVTPDLSYTDEHGEVLPPEAEELRDEYEAEHEAMVEAAEEYEENLANPEPPPAPTLTQLNPNEAEIGSADIILGCIGTGFTPGATIFFNGGEEPTTFVDETEVTTIVKPSTAGTPGSYPVLVRNADNQPTEPLDFTFFVLVEQEAAA